MTRRGRWMVAGSWGVAAAVLAGSVTQAQAPAAKLNLDDPKVRVSYALGLNIGQGMKAQGVEIDMAALARGLGDALSGGKALLTEAQMVEVLENLQRDMMAKEEASAKKVGAANQAEGDAFLAANAKKEGVKTTKSGLQYKVVKAGSGPKPTAADTVQTHYEGRLIDGTVFDSSYKRGEPATFPVKGVIPGWTEALQLMTVGSKWQLYIPAKLAYGPRGAGDKIGPNATLIFDIELLAIEQQ